MNERKEDLKEKIRFVNSKFFKTWQKPGEKHEKRRVGCVKERCARDRLKLCTQKEGDLLRKKSAINKNSLDSRLKVRLSKRVEGVGEKKGRAFNGTADCKA